MPVTAINKANTENRSGLYSQAGPGSPLNRDNTPRVKPQVGHGWPVTRFNRQSETTRS